MTAIGGGGSHVCAAVSRFESDAEPEALSIAARAPEAAGGDVSLVATADPTDWTGRKLAAADGRTLVRVDGYVTPTEATAKGARLIGVYALA